MTFSVVSDGSIVLTTKRKYDKVLLRSKHAKVAETEMRKWNILYNAKGICFEIVRSL